MTTALILDFLRKNWKIVLLVVFALLFYRQIRVISDLKKENARKDINLSQITKKDGSELTLTHEEYKTISTEVTQKIDSVAKVAKIAIRAVKNAEVISYTYKDTTKVQALTAPVQEVTAPPLMAVRYFKIPVNEQGLCWGFKGYILSSDSESTLTITERTASNSIQRLEVSKRFLGFLWFTKKSTFKAFSDCGEIKINKINFIKK